MSSTAFKILCALVVLLVLGALVCDACAVLRGWLRRGNYKRGYIAG